MESNVNMKYLREYFFIPEMNEIRGKSIAIIIYKSNLIIYHFLLGFMCKIKQLIKTITQK